MCFPTRAGVVFYQKYCNFEKTRVCKTVKIQRKHSMAYEIHKFAGVMHAVVVADGALEAKWARHSSHRPFLKSSRSGKMAIWTAKRPTKASRKGKPDPFWSRLGGKKVICLIGSAKNRFAKLCFPCGQEAQFWKNVSRKMSWSIKNMKKWCCNLNVWCKLASMATKFTKM